MLVVVFGFLPKAPGGPVGFAVECLEKKNLFAKHWIWVAIPASSGQSYCKTRDGAIVQQPGLVPGNENVDPFAPAVILPREEQGTRRCRQR